MVGGWQRGDGGWKIAEQCRTCFFFFFQHRAQPVAAPTPPAAPSTKLTITSPQPAVPPPRGPPLRSSQSTGAAGAQPPSPATKAASDAAAVAAAACSRSVDELNGNPQGGATWGRERDRRRAGSGRGHGGKEGAVGGPQRARPGRAGWHGEGKGTGTGTGGRMRLSADLSERGLSERGLEGCGQPHPADHNPPFGLELHRRHVLLTRHLPPPTRAALSAVGCATAQAPLPSDADGPTTRQRPSGGCTSPSTTAYASSLASR